MRLKTKICGITRLDDAKAAMDAGADAIGLVFYDPSPRHIGHNLDLAAEIALSVGPFVTVVGLVVNPDAESLNRVLSQVPVHVLQFHGDERENFCLTFNRPYMKAIRMKDGINVIDQINAYPRAAGVLLDTYKKGVPGGTGEAFNWERVPESAPRPIILAGGLKPENVSEAVRVARPYGVDVSGGVEDSPGVKSFNKIKAFVENAIAE